jgi:molybdopterin-containing oxidoreductase family membrane subunit
MDTKTLTEDAPALTENHSHSANSHINTYPKFLLHAFKLCTQGSWTFWAWIIFLTCVALVGANSWAMQVRDGMIQTGMTDQVSWGLYIANFTFLVGLAAGGVMMVIPAYIYKDKDMHDTVIIGELLAIASICMCLMFVIADLGRPDRAWHMIPMIGKFNWPISMLTWDVLVLNGYLLLNLHICGYLLYKRFLGEKPNPQWYLPFVFISIVWAISIHTVTAFLYCGLGGRPFWNTALLAPRFLTTAFCAGPAFIIVVLHLVRKMTRMNIGDGSIRTLAAIMRVTILINLVMLISELFTEFYTGGSHSIAVKYLYFGHHGLNALQPWIWASTIFVVVAAFLLMRPNIHKHMTTLIIACALVFVGIWIEKGMGLIIPGFIPSTLHEWVEYIPTALEWKISAGIWATGLIIYTMLLKVAIPIFSENNGTNARSSH